MGRSIFRQETQIRKSDTYDDTVTPSLANYETNPADIEDDLNSLRSAVNNIINRNGASFPVDNWYDDLTQPTTLENGTIRGVDAVNAALHAVEKKRVLRDVLRVGVDVVVTASQNWEVLGAGEIPTQTTAAVGAVTTLGTVVAFHSGTFDTHSLDEVAGTNTLNPKNLMPIFDGTTGDPILSAGRRVWGLLQSESATDGHTISGTTPNRVQISFVRPNAAYDDLEACPVSDIEGKTINYTSRERVRLEDLNEIDFLRGMTDDVPAGVSVTRQGAYDGQGVTPVDVITNSILDLEGAGLAWKIRDDLEADLFVITEGSAGGTSSVQIAGDVDTFDVNAVVNDFLNGASFDTGAAGTTINVGVTANQIDSGGALTIATGASGDLKLDSVAGEILFDDVNRTGSTWAATAIKLSEATAEWDNYETAFGEVSLMNAIVQAYNSSHRRRVFSVVTADAAADTNVSGPTDDNNLDTDLGDLSGGTFVDDYDVYLNGQLLRPGADAAANNDYYPGTSLANGQLKFEFKLKISDQLCVVDHVA